MLASIKVAMGAVQPALAAHNGVPMVTAGTYHLPFASYPLQVVPKSPCPAVQLHWYGLVVPVLTKSHSHVCPERAPYPTAGTTL